MNPSHPGIEYRPEITGLRALAVLPVIFFHAGFSWFSGGYVGVDVFFVISGYLITSIILREKRLGTFSLAQFYERRARRILPALFLVILATVPLAWTLMSPQQFRGYAQSVAAVAVFASNILFWRTTDYFDSAAEDKPLLHTWSLGVEEQYYVIFPLLVLALWRFGIARLGATILLLGLVSLGLSEWLGHQGEASANFFLAPSRAWELLIGSLLAYLEQYRPAWLRVSLRAKDVLSFTGLVLLLYAILAFNARTPFPGIHALVPTLGAVLIIAYATAGTLTGRILSMRWAVGVGLVSYSAYLWHQPVFAFARIALTTPPDAYLMAGLAALSLVLAYFSWRHVEMPCRSSFPMSRKVLLQASLAVSVAVALTGLLGQSKKVIEWRFKEAVASTELLQSLHKERNRLARSGVCSFGEKSGGARELTAFMEGWRCHGQDDGLIPLPVMLVGDSHSADRAMALRLNGFDVAQLGGGGCSLVPGQMTPLCRKLFDFAIEWMKPRQSIRFVALSNRFDLHELSPAALNEMMAYWSQSGKEIIFFTGMPEFPGLRSAIGKTVRPEPGLSWPIDVEPNLVTAQKSEREIRELQERYPNLHVINTRLLFCGATTGCDWQSNGELFLIDESHLSKVGAMRFGHEVVVNIRLLTATDR